MGYVDVIDKVQGVVEEANPISTMAQIEQAGVYLLFDNATAKNHAEDVMNFVFVVAAHTLNGDNSAAQQVYDVRMKIERADFEIKFEGVQRLEFRTGTMYVFAVTCSCEVNVKAGL